ncbi:MAG: hypothetical protein JWM80_639 [Cyanobacteria bacterium RYN_339]|nr:hypothetical protein [Cyanobacteria bacterium RYN_339]
MMIDFNPVVTFIPDLQRRELHARNADEPSPTPAPWLLLTVPAAGLPTEI